jgi:dihydrodipicolinate synthase/N-acetylneuraminate lyase
MKGVHAAIVTHFDSDLAVDHEAVAVEVQRLIDGGIHGIAVR